jgi:hypothetical protein
MQEELPEAPGDLMLLSGQFAKLDHVPFGNSSASGAELTPVAEYTSVDVTAGPEGESLALLPPGPDAVRNASVPRRGQSSVARPA